MRYACDALCQGLLLEMELSEEMRSTVLCRTWLVSPGYQIFVCPSCPGS